MLLLLRSSHLYTPGDFRTVPRSSQCPDQLSRYWQQPRNLRRQTVLVSILCRFSRENLSIDSSLLDTAKSGSGSDYGVDEMDASLPSPSACSFKPNSPSMREDLVPVFTPAHLMKHLYFTARCITTPLLSPPAVIRTLHRLSLVDQTRGVEFMDSVSKIGFSLTKGLLPRSSLYNGIFPRQHRL